MLERPAGNGAFVPLRISIVGSSGSGKSFLARQLAERLGVPVYSLDELKCGQGDPLPAHEFAALVDQLTQREAWILDGHYRDVRHLIWSRAQAVIWLNYPLPLVAMRLFSRFYRNRNGGPAAHASIGGNSRGGAGCGPVPSASWKRRFNRFLRTLRERREYPVVLALPQYSQAQCIELKSPRLAEKWLSTLGNVAGRENSHAIGTRLFRHSVFPSSLLLLLSTTENG